MSSLSFRAALATAVAMSCVGGAAGMVMWQISASALRSDFDRSLDQRLLSLGNMVRQDIRGMVYLDVNPLLMPEFLPGRQCEYFQLAGDALDTNSSFSLPSHAVLTLSAVSVVPLSISRGDLLLPDGRRGRIAGMRVIAAPEWDSDAVPSPLPAPQTVILTTARSREGLDAQLAKLSYTALLATMATTIISGGIAVLIVRRVLRPLSDLAQAVALLDPNNPEQRLPASVEIELAPLVSCVNGATDRMLAAYLREQRFTAMAAHELRTPLAELRAASEVAVRWPDDIPGLLRAANEGTRISQHLSRQVDMLMAITRCREGAMPLQAQAGDLGAIAREVCMKPPLDVRGLRLESHCAPAAIFCDTAVVEALASNLIGNALAHADQGAWLRVETRCDAENSYLIIANPASQLTVADLERFAEPYWRKDAVRGDRHHAGLGLTLCLAMAKAVGASVSWQLDAHILRVTLAMPMR